MVGLGLRMLPNPEGPFAIRPRADPEFLAWLARFWRSANAAHVRRTAPALLELLLAGRDLYADLDGETEGAFGFTRNGLLMLCGSLHTLAEESALAKQARGLGLEADVLTPGEVTELEPGVRMEGAGGVFFPGDCHLDPGRLVSCLTDLLEREGVRFEWETAATGWQVEGARIAAVRTARGELRADEFVVAGGSWSGQLVRSLGIRLLLQPGKGYNLTLRELPRRPRIPLVLVEARVAVTPMGGSLRFAGTMELGSQDPGISARRVEGIRRSIPAYLPDFGQEHLRDAPAWSGLRPCSPDGLPYIGRPRAYENLSIGTGHAMLGVSLGLVTGRSLAELLCREEPSLDLRPFHPDRFTR
jgi:D-amino-acid dehydrogenase